VTPLWLVLTQEDKYYEHLELDYFKLARDRRRYWWHRSLAARIIVKLTPTPVDDSFLEKIVNFLKTVGLNIK
jgi:hypothetical protein